MRSLRLDIAFGSFLTLLIVVAALGVRTESRAVEAKLKEEIALLAEGHNLQRDKIKALGVEQDLLRRDLQTIQISLVNLSRPIPPAPPRTDDAVLSRIKTLEKNSDIYYHRFESTDLILTAVGVQIDTFTKKLRDIENHTRTTFGPGGLDGVTNVKGRK